MNPESLTLTGSDLVNPQDQIKVPETTPPEQPSDFVHRAISPLVQVDTEESRERDRVFNDIQNVDQNGPSFDGAFDRELRSLGTPDAVNRLRDVETNLSRLNTSFDVQNVQIAEGNSIGQSQRAVSQNERERAVRTAGLAAEAQVLQGNISTAQAIARDTVQFAFEDRRLELQQLGAQYDALQDRVSGQEAQLLDQRRRELDEAQRQLEVVENNVAAAMTSGVATPDDITALTSPNTTDEEKIALAQEIQGRVAAQEAARAEAESAALVAQRNASAYSSNLSAQKTQAELDQINNAVNQVQSGGIYGVMQSSQGGKPTDASFNQSLSKAFTLSNQLSSLSQTFQDDAALRNVADGIDLAPIEAIWRSANPYDEKAQAIKAQLTAIVPNLARGIYGEVGVLTDTDFEKYSQTLPNLSSPEELRDAMMMITLDAVKNSVADQIEISASTGRDVSGLIPRYERFEAEIGKASAPTLMKSKTVTDLVAAGADSNQINTLLQEGYSLSEIESAFIQ